jgi:hypothetical protein
MEENIVNHHHRGLNLLMVEKDGRTVRQYNSYFKKPSATVSLGVL